MSFMKQTVLLLLLAIAANAEMGPENCGGLNVTLSPNHMDKVYGDWVLISSFGEGVEAEGVMKNLSSSQVEFFLLPDKQTLSYIERNLHDKLCTTYFMKLQIPNESHHNDHDEEKDDTHAHINNHTHSEHHDQEHAHDVDSDHQNDHSHDLHLISPYTIEKDGVVVEHNDTGIVNFFETEADSLILHYKGDLGEFLLSYRRKGHPQDADHVKKDQADFEKLAECEGISQSLHFTYDGVSDLCHKAPVPEVHDDEHHTDADH